MIKLSAQEKADLKVYVGQEPFKLFQKVLLQWHEHMAAELRDRATPDNILMYQGILRGLSQSVTVLACAATDPNFGLEAQHQSAVQNQVGRARGANRPPLSSPPPKSDPT